MENASKALLIAGGVLIAILIVSVLVVTLNIVNSNQKTREKALATEQLAEFNQKYEAYNKKALRGTDIITLMKMAIENNNNMEATQKGQQYFINVILKLNVNIRKSPLRHGLSSKHILCHQAHKVPELLDHYHSFLIQL